MEGGGEVSGGLFITCGDAMEVFDRVEKTLHQIAFAVKGKVAIPFHDTVCLGRDHRLDGADFQALQEGVAVAALVGKHRARPDFGSQSLGPGDVMGLPAGQAEGDGIAQSVDDGVDFRRQPTTRATYGLVETPFLRAPALC